MGGELKAWISFLSIKIRLFDKLSGGQKNLL